MIWKETYDLLKGKREVDINKLKITDVYIGVYMTAIKLSDNSYGVASTIANSDVHCDKKSRDYGVFTPLHIQGENVTSLFESEHASGFVNTLRMACLNAMSMTLLHSSDYKVLRDTDPVDLLDLSSKSNITIVGAFHSYIKRFAKSEHSLRVLELNEKALLPEHREYYVPAKEYARVLSNSEVVIITGSSFLNNTMEELLAVIPQHAQVVVTGPSCSIIPDILFKHKVDFVGATEITKPDILFPLVSQGAAGYHLFEYCAEKITLVNDGMYA